MATRLRLAMLGVCLGVLTSLGADFSGMELDGGGLVGPQRLGSGLGARESVGPDIELLTTPIPATSEDRINDAPSRISTGRSERRIGLFSLRAPRVIRPKGFRVYQGGLHTVAGPTPEAAEGLAAFLPESPIKKWNQAHHWHKNSGFIDLNSYWDTREMAVTTVNLQANLPGGFQYYQFMNYESAASRGNHDWTGFYSELNLRHSIWRSNPFLAPFDWVLQYADGTGPEDLPHGVLRGGIRWRLQDTPGKLGAWLSHHWKLKYALTFYCLDTNASGWQMEHMYRRDFFGDLMYISGFCDHYIGDQSGHSNWMHEHQLGIRLVPSLYAVAEYRYNDFFPAGQRSGMGIGMEYIIRF